MPPGHSPFWFGPAAGGGERGVVVRVHPPIWPPSVAVGAAGAGAEAAACADEAAAALRDAAHGAITAGLAELRADAGAERADDLELD